MAKKRKSSTQSSTLDSFFIKFSPWQGHKKPRLQEDLPRTKQRQAKASSSTTLSPEIIVVESDEECVEVVSTFSRASGSQVRRPQISQTAGGSQSTPIVCEDWVDTSLTRTPPRAVRVIPDKHASSPSRGEDNQENDWFGRPSALLLPDTSAECPESAEPCTFGTPSALLSPSISDPAGIDDARILVLNLPTGSSVPPVLEPSTSFRDISTGELIAQEWATGDDEMDLDDPELLAEMAEEEVVNLNVALEDEIPFIEGDTVTRCPLCDAELMNLTAADMERHVNLCLDSTIGSTSLASSSPKPIPTFVPPESSPTKPLHPVSPSQPPQTPIIEQDPVISPPYTAKKTQVFSVLMSSHKENEAWKEASAAEDRSFRPTKGNGGRRKAPFYKIMQGMPIAVDAFRYGTIPGISAYFLTHAHSDHYTNLSANWRSGPIYCSEGTANLIIHMLGVDPQWVHALPMDVATIIPQTGGVQVTLIEANHCPGSCLFLFEGPQTVNAGDSAFKSSFVGSSKTFRYLHCGDFRASPRHVNHPSVKGKLLDHVYLDTTYLDPKASCFITACAELARRLVVGQSLHDVGDNSKGKRTMDSWLTSPEKEGANYSKPGRVLVVVGTYSIGKERIVKAIAHALQTKIYCDSRKAALLRCQADPELDALLTKDPMEGGVHLVPLSVIASDRLKDYVERYKGHYHKAVGFRPTGWTFSAPAGTDVSPAVATVISRSQSRNFTHTHLNPMKNSTAALQIYGVPYSEHSSFFELTCFALSVNWGKMIATVNVGSENSRKKMEKWIERWEAERKKRTKGEVVEQRAEDYW
ncbi:uncharacterized protein FIBRA_09280 [Fibroporia radiculosa]|uniref:DNA repair metallo-beta-lactamase domain-containing protein n=1 Tax=Fibroporia radiculosa TaxID=599839 RepID=J7SC85_9APHY|nr:uncharacterized protein FIBRA_09280 [Fibroporia radiculosa]CCM06966.1 predicted protein [Fibroporia radiculosa]